MLVTFGICFKQHFDTRYLVFYNPSIPRMFLSLDLSEYRIQHGAIAPLCVTSSYSTCIFCKGVLGFATDCPYDVRCRGLTTFLLHVGPPFGNLEIYFKHQLSCRFDKPDSISSFFFYICNYICLDTSYNFWLYLYFLNILYIFKYSCTNIFHRRSLCAFLWINFNPSMDK